MVANHLTFQNQLYRQPTCQNPASDSATSLWSNPVPHMVCFMLELPNVGSQPEDPDKRANEMKRKAHMCGGAMRSLLQRLALRAVLAAPRRGPVGHQLLTIVLGTWSYWACRQGGEKASPSGTGLSEKCSVRRENSHYFRRLKSVDGHVFRALLPTGLSLQPPWAPCLLAANAHPHCPRCLPLLSGKLVGCPTAKAAPETSQQRWAAGTGGALSTHRRIHGFSSLTLAFCLKQLWTIPECAGEERGVWLVCAHE